MSATNHHVAITGHANLEKALGFLLVEPQGQTYNMAAFDQAYFYLESGLDSFCTLQGIPKDSLCMISGMARGADEIAAAFAIRNHLPLILFIPNSIAWHKNRGLSRGMRAQAIYYERILSYPNLARIDEVKKDYRGGDYRFANFARNQAMVDQADSVFSLQTYSSSGTDDCVRRAKRAGKFKGNLFPASV